MIYIKVLINVMKFAFIWDKHVDIFLMTYQS